LEAAKQSEELIWERTKTEDKNDKIIIDEIKVKKKSRPKKIIVDGDTTLKNKRKTKKTSKNLG
jgi:hypothetical protein